MLLLDRSESTEVVYTIQDGVSPFYYREWLNEKGEVTDSLLQDKNGFEISDINLLERVMKFVDELEEGV
jgi:hypothetical protein